jgi:hypothetical protein
VPVGDPAATTGPTIFGSSIETTEPFSALISSRLVGNRNQPIHQHAAFLIKATAPIGVLNRAADKMR